MTRARFRGFPIGSEVSVAASKGGEIRQASVPAWKTPGTASVTITLTRSPSGIAPEGVWLEAQTSGFDVPSPGVGEVYDARLHRLHYEWDFGPGITGDYAAPDNIPSAFKSKRYAFGPKVGKIFPAGTHDISCTVRLPGTSMSAQATAQIVVTAPESVHAATDEYAVATDGDFTGLPVSVPLGNRFTDLDTAWASYISNIDRGRIFLKRGQTFPLNAKINGHNSHVTAFGSGANPIIAPTYSGNERVFDMRGKRSTDPRDEFRLENVDIAGDWNPRLETSASGGFHSGLDVDGGYHVQTIGCSFTGLRTCLLIGSYFETPRVFIEDCIFEDWQNYGSYSAEPDLFAVVGSRFAHSAQAWAGGGPKGTKHNDHGPLRWARGGNVYVGKNEFFSKAGWTYIGPYPAYQPCLRPNQNNWRGVFYNIVENYFESGFEIISQKNASPPGAARIGNYICDKNVFHANSNTLICIASECTGWTVRNNLMVKDDVAHDSNNFNKFMLWRNRQDGLDPDLEAENAMGPIEVYGNTCYDPRSAAEAKNEEVVLSLIDGTITGVLEENNILHIPNGQVVKDAGTFDLTQYLPTRYLGRNFTIKTDPATLDASFATPAGSMVKMKPMAGNPNIGTATSGLVPYDDIEGKVRGASPSKGAWEPD